jgi:hypothetical protein
VFAGHTTRSSLIIAAGTAQPPITILTGTIPSTPAITLAFVASIPPSPAMVLAMARTQPARRSATMAGLIRLEWRPGQNGSVVATWRTMARAHQPGISSAWSFSWLLTQLAARRRKVTRARHLTLPSTRGVARPRRAASSGTSCKRLSKVKKLRVSRWWLLPVTPVRLVPRCQIPRPFMKLPTQWERWSMAPTP